MLKIDCAVVGSSIGCLLESPAVVGMEVHTSVAPGSAIGCVRRQKAQPQL
ncbi:hypothetical protein HanIR_Chr13g0659051 [Helianthus annuus]|nr:hypothetical protein HanIR_Chr13g0659051 [Helianthus annuus]